MSLERKIETTANVATIIVALLISAVLAKTYVFPNSVQPATAAVQSGPEVARGKTVDGKILGLDWAKNHRTLVLAISTSCHFCTDSVPFYRKLGAEDKGVKMVAVLPQAISESKDYLDVKGVRVDEIKQAPLNTLGVRATPTLLLVDGAGVVTDVWVGKLQPDQEAQVLSAIEKKSAGD